MRKSPFQIPIRVVTADEVMQATSEAAGWFATATENEIADLFIEDFGEEGEGTARIATWTEQHDSNIQQLFQYLANQQVSDSGWPPARAVVHISPADVINWLDQNRPAMLQKLENDWAFDIESFRFTLPSDAPSE